MSRGGLTDTYVTSSAGTVNISYAVYLDFSSGASRVWSGLNDITITDDFGGGTYSGLGGLGNISQVVETTEVSAKGVELTLSGIDSNILSLALTDQYRGREMAIYALFHNDDFSAYEQTTIFRGRMNQMKIQEGEDSSTISMTCESRLILLERPKERHYTNEDQTRLYPGDLGLEYLSTMVATDIYWGSASPSQKTSVTNAGYAKDIEDIRGLI